MHAFSLAVFLAIFFGVENKVCVFFFSVKYMFSQQINSLKLQNQEITLFYFSHSPKKENFKKTISNKQKLI